MYFAQKRRTISCLANCITLHQMAQKYPCWKTVVSIIAKKGHKFLAQMNEFSARNIIWTNVQKIQFS